MPGMTNRLLAPVVDAAAITYEESVRFFGDKAFVSGNPVRPEFFRKEGAHGDDGSPPGAARILVCGGSQGAHAINMAMVEAAPRPGCQRTSGDYAPDWRARSGNGPRQLPAGRAGSRVEPFLYAMDREMKTADLVVCRAGATTLAELMASGRASILVPLPTAADDHQRRNALALVKQGAAYMVEQRELSGDRLATEVVSFAADADRRRQMGAAARRLARPDAAKVIVDRVLQLAGVA